MKIGKLPEPMLIRSVLKEVKHRREEILVGPAVGQDCAVFEPKEGDVLVFSTDPITGTVKDIGSHSVHITANDLAASGSRTDWNYAYHASDTGNQGRRIKRDDAWSGICLQSVKYGSKGWTYRDY